MTVTEISYIRITCYLIRWQFIDFIRYVGWPEENH